MVLSIVNHKGGTCKTTTTVNLGCALARRGKKVLLLDLDAQGSLSYSLNIVDSTSTITNVLLEGLPLTAALQEREGLHVLPADETLTEVELTLSKFEMKFNKVKDLESQYSQYDFVLIDCPPSVSLLTVNALVASNYVLIPMQMDVLALRGLDSIMNTVQKINLFNQKLSILGVVPVMVDSRKNIHQEIINHIKSTYAIRIFSPFIRSCVKAAEAPSFGESVIKYAPSCNTSCDYLCLADAILKSAHAECYEPNTIN